MRGIDSNVIYQIAIIVEDIETVAKNYADMFGMELPEIWTVPPAEEVPVYFRGELISPIDTQICFFEMGNVVLELTQPGVGPSAWREFYDTYGQGVHHLGFFVEDKEKALGALAEKGAEAVLTGYYPTVSYTFVDSMKQFGVNFNIKHRGEDNSDKIK